MRFIGRAVELCYQVANTGMAVADNVEAEAIIPEGGRVRGLTEGGEVRGNRVVWRLGDLVPGTNQNYCARMTFDRAAVFRLAGRVATDCLENVGAFRGGGSRSLILRIRSRWERLIPMKSP